MPQCSSEEVPDKPSKKKRWWGDLFRRSSKSRRKPSDSSSDEDVNHRRGFLGRKRHSDRGSKDVTNSFLINSGLRDVPRGRSLDSVKSPERSTKRRIKAKVEASRELLRDSSSDEASSYTSSLQSGGSFPRRSRAARTERHIRRLSKDLDVQNALNKSKWSANVVYQECKEYDRKFRAKARSATPSPAQSPKVKRPAGRATSFDNIKSSPPPPPPRKLPDQRPLSLETPMKVYNPPMYTAPPQAKTKARYQPDYINEPWLPSDQSPEDAKKPPAAPPRKQISIEERRRQQNNLEEALNELEAIYKKLASEDIVDSQSEMSEDKRRLEDDMAYRRLNKREPSCQDVREIMSQSGSYLLVSPTLSPPPIVPHSPVMNSQEPDIISDDVVYRTIQHTNNTLKISDPQPLFGIPIGPISPSTPSDYLHVEAKPRYDFRPSNLPDVVRDDLAFRNLRKDAREVKKKKAVRSLSANLTNLIRNNNNFNVQNNNLEGKSSSFQDLSDDVRITQNVTEMKSTKEEEKDENKRYLSELCASENDLLRELEEEARATSVQLDEELRQLSELQDNEPSIEALYSRSMTDLLKELTKNLDYDFGFNDETPVVLTNCQTCDTQGIKHTKDDTKNLEVPIDTHSNENINKRLDIAECRRQFFESPHFNKKIDKEYSIDKGFQRSDSKGSRELEKDTQRYTRSPSNPESSYNEKFFNGHDFRSSRSPIRSGSADSSSSIGNIKSFIERPFSRNSKVSLEPSRSFNDKYTASWINRNPGGITSNAKPSSFSSDRDFVNNDLNKEKNPTSFGSISFSGTPKLYNEFCRSNSSRKREKKLNDIRQRINKSPVSKGSSEKNSSLEKPISQEDLSYEDSTKQFVETYRKMFEDKDDRKSYSRGFDSSLDRCNKEELLSRNLRNSLDRSTCVDSNASFQSRTISEDNSYVRGADFGYEKQASNSFDSDLKSLIKESKRNEALKQEKGGSDASSYKPFDLISRVRSNPGLETGNSAAPLSKYDTHPQESTAPDTEHQQQSTLPECFNISGGKPIVDTISLSPSTEVMQKRRSFAGSSDIQVDDQYPKETVPLRSLRTPIDLEAIENDTSSRGPTPPSIRYESPSQNNDDRMGGSVTDVAGLARNGVTNSREEESKQGTLVWTAYWLACSQQLIGLDLITILALILAVISIFLFLLI